MNIKLPSAVTCGIAVKLSAYSDLDNGHANYAQRNASELADLLKAEV
jgi:hypothetical protein